MSILRATFCGMEPTSWEELSIIMASKNSCCVSALQHRFHQGIEPLRNGGVEGMASALPHWFSLLQGIQV